MSSFCKSYSQFFSKNISVYAIFNNTLTNNFVSFEQLGLVLYSVLFSFSGDNLHEMSVYFFGKIKTKFFNMLSAEFGHSDNG